MNSLTGVLKFFSLHRPLYMALIVFILLLANESALALDKTTSISPMLLPGYRDIDLIQELIFHPQNTGLLSVNYSDKRCWDCSPSGHSFGKGAGLFYRHYFTSALETSWLGEVGLGFFDGKAINTRSGDSSQKSLWETTFSLGKRYSSTNNFLFDILGGFIYRSTEIETNGYTGYRHLTPVVSFAFGVKW